MSPKVVKTSESERLIHARRSIQKGYERSLFTHSANNSRQTSILSMFRQEGTQTGRIHTGCKVVDLFCGIGGFSCGAEQAGHRVCMAVDYDRSLLDIHKQNHPDCEHHICKVLPCDDLCFPTGDEPWHLHGSPPCTKLSIMNIDQYKHEQDHAIELVVWFLSLVRKHNPTSWSMEQVNHKRVRQHLDRLSKSHPSIYSWTVVDMVDYGIPQHRKRIIAGSPMVISNFVGRKCCYGPRRTLRDTFPHTKATYVGNDLKKRPDHVTGESVDVPVEDKFRSVDLPCYTIMCTSNRKWCDESGNIIGRFSCRDSATIQGFPEEFILYKRCVASKMGVGNAVPPPVAKILMTP